MMIAATFQTMRVFTEALDVNDDTFIYSAFRKIFESTTLDWILSRTVAQQASYSFYNKERLLRAFEYHPSQVRHSQQLMLPASPRPQFSFQSRQEGELPLVQPSVDTDAAFFELGTSIAGFCSKKLTGFTWIC